LKHLTMSRIAFKQKWVQSALGVFVRIYPKYTLQNLRMFTRLCPRLFRAFTDALVGAIFMINTWFDVVLRKVVHFWG